jgi:hypothetical protein
VRSAGLRGYMLFPLDQHLPSLPAIDCHSKREEIFAPGNNDLHTVRPFSARPVIARVREIRWP